jgi:hypothetical protein
MRGLLKKELPECEVPSTKKCRIILFSGDAAHLLTSIAVPAMREAE